MKMDEYPNSDEEFELMYGDELDAIREQEELLFGNNTSKNQHKTKAVQVQQTSTTVDVQSTIQLSRKDDTQNSINLGSQLMETNEFVSEIEISQVNPLPSTSSTKRTIQELFGEIDDILSEEFIDGQLRKRKKPDNNSDLELIEQIIELRKQAKERRNPLSIIGVNQLKTDEDYFRHNVSYTIPKYSYVTITKNNGQKLYVRCHSEEFEKLETEKIGAIGNFSEVMGKSFKEIWKEANEIINKDLNIDATELSGNMPLSNYKESAQNNTDLWVDLYKPTKYLELLSDESTNRTLLRWLKLWDKVVFNRRPKIKVNKINTGQFNTFQKELNFKLDENGYPEHKVVLLCGPPGLGKTTLAHLIARHAGYNVVEVNASDDRSTEKFKTILDSATQMRSVIDKENRPNCVVFDEIDGAPSSSIEYLIKFINGTAKSKKKKGNVGKTKMLKRPIICICNDVYVPALRPLRQIAFVVNFPPTVSARLADRLNEIARRQKIKTDLGALLALCEKSGNDIRNCLSVLHFFKSLSKPITLSQVYKTDVGQKDIQKSLFAVWQEIFQIKQPTHREMEKKTSDRKQDQLGLSNRMKKVLQVVNSFGDYDRLAQGIFENYANMSVKDSTLSATCEALEWFCYVDVLNKQIYSLQNYTLSSYIPYAFVVWHFIFASLSWQKINYPSTSYENKLKANKNMALLTEALKGMQPSARAFTYPSALLLDTLPILSRIIVPSLRSVNLHLYTKDEKRQIQEVVSSMLDYNLNYVQERTPEGTYTFNLDPNIHDLVLFSNSKPKQNLSYVNKQLIMRELEVEKMRRVENFKYGCEQKGSIQKDLKENKLETKSVVPNHLQTLQTVKSNKSGAVTKDFFGRIITKVTNADTIAGNKNDIWFKFKEGYTNAVRKKIKIYDLK